MDLKTLLPYTHVYTTATCPKVKGHLITLAALAAPVRLTTFIADVKKAAKEHRGTITGDSQPIFLSCKGGTRVLGSFAFESASEEGDPTDAGPV